MKIVYTIGGIVDLRFPRQGINIFKKAGMNSTVLDFGAFPRFQHVLEDMLKKNNIHTPIAIYPFNRQGNELMSERMEYIRQGKIDASYDGELNWKCPEFSYCVKEAKEYSCQDIIVSPYEGVDLSSETYDKNFEAYIEAGKLASAAGVHLLIMNQIFYKEKMGRLVRGFGSDCKSLAKMIDDLNLAIGDDVFGVCLHIGNANIGGQDMNQMCRYLGSRLKAVWLTDNDGEVPGAKLPFTQCRREHTTDWLSIIRGLRAVNFDGTIIMDASETVGGFSPLLREHVLPLVVETAKYFAWQVDIENQLRKYKDKKIVLFGAGNMCRNYMKCYGDEYTPLFTCDNNPKMWDTEFCGLKVKNPEVLRELDEDTVVFICNVFYWEIHQQLNELGVKNVHYFNDEYMPSMYFTRLGDNKKELKKKAVPKKKEEEQK